MSLAADDGEQQTANATTLSNPDVKPLFAVFGVRMAGVAIDLFIAMFIANGVQAYVIEAIGLTVTDHRPIILAVLLLYFSVFWSSRLLATPAQLLLGMRVVDEMGERLSLGRAILRSTLLIGLIAATLTLFKTAPNVYFVAIALAGYGSLFLAAVTPNRQAGHDLLAHSLVVNKIALKSPERRGQLREQVSDRDPVSRKRHRPTILSIFGNVFVLGVPALVLLTAAQVANDRDLRYRTGYALEEVTGLKTAVEVFYAEYTRWPTSQSELGAATKGRYPDGGYYELEDDGVIRIRFTVKSELKNGSIVLNPRLEDGRIIWECRSEGDFAQQYLRASCRE